MSARPGLIPCGTLATGPRGQDGRPGLRGASTASGTLACAAREPLLSKPPCGGLPGPEPNTLRRPHVPAPRPKPIRKVQNKGTQAWHPGGGSLTRGSIWREKNQQTIATLVLQPPYWSIGVEDLSDVPRNPFFGAIVD